MGAKGVQRQVVLQVEQLAERAPLRLHSVPDFQYQFYGTVASQSREGAS